jgi:hypothetical protein
MRRRHTGRANALPIAPNLNGVALSTKGRHPATTNLDGTIFVLRLANVGEVVRVP